MPYTFSHSDPESQKKQQDIKSPKREARKPDAKDKSTREDLMAWIKGPILVVVVVLALAAAVWSGVNTIRGPQEIIVGSLDGGMGEGKPGAEEPAGAKAATTSPATTGGTTGATTPAVDPSNPTGSGPDPSNPNGKPMK